MPDHLAALPFSEACTFVALELLTNQNPGWKLKYQVKQDKVELLMG